MSGRRYFVNKTLSLNSPVEFFLSKVEGEKFLTLLKKDFITDVLAKIMADSQVNHSQGLS